MVTAPTTPLLPIEVLDGVATLTLNRPEVGNSLSFPLLKALLEALRWAQNKSEVRVIILTGAGEKVFCAGADLNSFTSSQSELELHTERGIFVELFRLLPELGKPLIGRINGHALAGGFGLACACDLLVAIDSATFGTPEINLGLWPAMIQSILQRNLPRKPLLEMLLLGQRWSATQMHQLWLVNRVVNSFSELDAVVKDLTSNLTKWPAETLKLGRDSFYQQQDMEYATALSYLQGQLSLLSLSPAVKSKISAFLNRSHE